MTIPQLILSRKALWDMISETLRYPYLETMWANFGFILPDGSVYLAGIIPPLEGCVVRKYATSSFGGERLADAFQWVEDHANQINQNVSARFTALYKGHSHHQLALFAYSGTDVNSIVEFVRDNDGVDVAIGPLTVIRPGTSEKQRKCNRNIYRSRRGVEVKFYQYTRAMLEAGITQPSEVETFRVVNDLPGISVPQLGWQFLQEEEYKKQISRLEARGYQVIVRDKRPPTIRLFVKKPTWNGGMILIEIPLGFPKIREVIGTLPADGPFFDASGRCRYRDFLRIVQSLEKEMTAHVSL
jgi:hypothetical protein